MVGGGERRHTRPWRASTLSLEAKGHFCQLAASSRDHLGACPGGRAERQSLPGTAPYTHTTHTASIQEASVDSLLLCSGTGRLCRHTSNCQAAVQPAKAIQLVWCRQTIWSPSRLLLVSLSGASQPFGHSALEHLPAPAPQTSRPLLQGPHLQAMWNVRACSLVTGSRP